VADAGRAPPNLNFAYLSGAAFVAALIVAGVFVAFADRLAFLTSALYYILLMPIALAAAAFLFGAMKSHAKYRGEVAKGSLQLGGPVVVFAMVLLGGIVLANPVSTSTLTVRLSGPPGSGEIISAGEVILDLGDDRRTADLGSNGQVTFAQVPIQFLSGEVSVIARVDRYRMKDPGPFEVPPARVIAIAMERIPDVTTVTGTLLRGDRPLAGGLVSFRDGLVTARTDENGNFRVDLPLPEGEVVPVTVTANGRTIYDDNYVVSAAVGLRVAVDPGP
jgi:hypothetical protein